MAYPLGACASRVVHAWVLVARQGDKVEESSDLVWGQDVLRFSLKLMPVL
jgi:hypothetical protein